MCSFLFDIEPVFGQIRVTVRLAGQLHDNGCTVCYTDTSDSVFTDRLLRQGIGRMIYPSDLRWFKPDLTLLGFSLNARARVYAKHGIPVVYVTACDGAPRQEPSDGIPLLRLPPSPCRPLSRNVRETEFLDKIREIKEKQQRAVIIGIPEHHNRHATDAGQIYRIIRHCASEHDNYQFILLTDSEEIGEELLALPENVCLYRPGNLHELLKVCDLALVSEAGSVATDCTFAHLPVWELSGRAQKRLTPRKLDREIQSRLANRTHLAEQQKQLSLFYEQENRKIDRIARELTENLKQMNRT